MASNFDLIVNSVREGRGMPDGLSPMEALPSALRGAFRAPIGYHFVASDLSQIELRVLAWVTNCESMMNVFRRDEDPYIDFAAARFGTTYIDLAELVNAGDKEAKGQRQFAKPAVLSCGYGTGGGKEVYDCCGNDVYTRDGEENEHKPKCEGDGDIVKTGLWGYAESMGVFMSQQEAHEIVQAYRAKYREVPRFWYDSEDAIRGLLQNEHRETEFERLKFTLWPNKLLKVTLPSGRSLHYLKPRLVESANGRKPQIEYETELPGMGKKRGHRRLYGSLFTENIVQAIARDVMAVGMVRAHRDGFSLVGHTHDEIVTLQPKGARQNLVRLNKLMTHPIKWCSDLPLKSAGWEDEIYRKD